MVLTNIPPEKREATACQTPLRLDARLHESVKRFLATGKPQELVRALGSPLNLLFPQLIHQNIEQFHAVFERHQLRGRVYFAHKANRSDSLVRQIALEDCFIDVASENELKHALGAGFVGSRIECTGPKSPEFIRVAVMHDCVISLDSQSELQTILQTRRKLALRAPTRLLIRLSGFHADHSNFLSKASRFGIATHECTSVLDSLDEHRADVDLLGFAFHVDTVNAVERAVAIESCLQFFEEATARGFEPRVLNIGGGYKVSYLESPAQWNAYTSALRESVLGIHPPLTWQNNPFGLSVDKGTLKGNLNVYSFYDGQAGARFLDELLSQRFPEYDDRTAGDMLRDNMIELWIEPGRSLLDQVGITLARVNSIKKSSHGDTLVGLNMKRQDVSFLDQEIFVDPIVLYKKGGGLKASDTWATAEAGANGSTESRTDDAASAAIYFTGNLCLESDLIYRHKTFLPQLPQEGDLVAFINTAGYFMDFSACEAIMQPTARKVAVLEDGEGFGWTLDSEYTPVSKEEEVRDAR